MTSTPPSHLFTFKSNNPLPASPLHRHQFSLEDVINFSAEPPLGADQRAGAKRRFDYIVNHFEAEDSSNGKYKRTALLRLMYEHARSDESRDIFLKAFFRSMKLSMDEDEDEDINFDDENVEEEFRTAVFDFADYLLDSFFLPLKASTKKTPQPTPVYHSAVQEAQGGIQELAGTPGRVSRLRGACLKRDRHRCVITRRFDQDEAIRRINESGNGAIDDDRNFLVQDADQFEPLEVAHILPHSLSKGNPGSPLDSSKKAALEILNMFDHGVLDSNHSIEGIKIDQSYNALTLTHTFHRLFGDFQVFFTHLTEEQPHTYRIETFLPPVILRDLLPVTRTLYLTETRTIDPPSPRLLAIHRAIAHILHLSAAGVYIDKMLRDMEEKGIQADGSTELGRFVRFKLGWGSDGTVEA